MSIITKRLALFTYDGHTDGDPITVAMQCEVVGYTRVSEWKGVAFETIKDTSADRDNLEFQRRVELR